MILLVRRKLCYILFILLSFILAVQFLASTLSQNRFSAELSGQHSLTHQITHLNSYQLAGNNFSNATCPVPKKHRDVYQAPIALATIPGSGTTWVRYLIEESTGYLTATIYDRDNENFKGSNFKDGRAIVIKTHFLYNEFQLPHHSMLDFGKALVLIRHPRSSIIAEVNRQFTDNPQGFMDLSWNDSETLEYQAHLAKRWPKFIKSWLNDFHRPKLVIVYERIHSNKHKILNDITKFLNVPLLEEGLLCLQNNTSGYALRNKQVPRPKYLHASIEKLIQQGLSVSYPTLAKYGIYYSSQIN